MQNNRNVPIFIAVVTSAALLIAAFPNFNQPWCAWVALAPWLLLLARTSRRAAFGWSWLIGFLFFLGSIWWLMRVTVIGWVLLCAYLALFFGVFGWLVGSAGASRRSSLVMVPAVWVALEYARSQLLSGFGWNLLAYSQTPWTPAMQIAEVTGAWGVSFVIAAVNVALAHAVQRGRAAGWRSVRVPLSLAAGLLAALLSAGAWRISRMPLAPPVRIAVTQGNIPQHKKWDPDHQEAILATYERLTREAALRQPALIVWPETSTPGFFGVEEDLTQRVMRLAAETGRPLLVGSPVPKFTPGGMVLMNSAQLLLPDGDLAARYNKQHLVPFGEFIPFERVLPWLRHVLPPIGDFVPGHVPTVFRAERAPSEGSRAAPPFSVLVCFEDLFPELARAFVQQGAQMLLVITNDGWFGPTAAAYQHAQASTFRAVELRVPVVRAANTGWSGCIDQAGRWGPRVTSDGGRELFVEGVAACEVSPGSVSTLYQRWGDWFALGCLLATAVWLVGRGLVFSGIIKTHTT